MPILTTLTKVAVEVLWSEPIETNAYVFQRLKIGRVSERSELEPLKNMYEPLRQRPPVGVPEEGGRFFVTDKEAKTGFLGGPLKEVVATVYISRENVMKYGLLPGTKHDLTMALECGAVALRPEVAEVKRVFSGGLVEWFDESPETPRSVAARAAVSRAATAFKTYCERVQQVTPLSAIPNIKDCIEDVIFNGPAVTVKWTDGTKTTVKARNGETIDPEKGFAMAVTKKVFGNNREYYHTVLHWLKKSKK